MKVSESDILNASILLVDDQEGNIELLRQLLGEAGHTRVTWTMKPQEVCTLHSKNRCDLILLDLHARHGRVSGHRSPQDQRRGRLALPCRTILR